MIMFLFLLALWILLNGRVTLEIVLVGLAIAGIVYLFCVKVLGYHPRHEKRLLKRLGLYLVYTAVLIWEILKANWQVMRTILRPGAEYEPAIVPVKVPLKKEVSRVFLANSITLTPGTVTVDEQDGEFLVLCLDKSSAEDIPDWSLVRILKKLEGEAWN